MKILRLLAISALALGLLASFSLHVFRGPALAQGTSVPRVNVPFFEGEIRFPEMAIFWFGRVTPTETYADVRVGYNASELYVYVAIFDQRIWYDTTPTPAELPQWDAVTLYLSLSDSFGASTYRFVSQLSWWEPRENYQRAYQGSSNGWTEVSINFTSQSAWRGNAPNDDTDTDRGWAMGLRIPFASLGLSGPPASGTQWRIAVTVHDRDSELGPPRPDTHWPATFSPTTPQTWGRLSFGLPTYTPPPATSGGTVTIRHGLNNVVVPDAGVGGTTPNLCPGDENYIWNGWGEDNFGTQPDFNIQNQSDIADWPCFAKYYITFPLDAIPPGKVILSATLTIYQFGNSGGPGEAGPSWIQVLTTDSDWNEQTISWNNAPLASENIGGAWVPTILPDQWPGWPGVPRNFDVSLAVARAYSAGQPVRLILYEADAQYHSGKYFVSSNTGDWNAQGRPTLTVVWGNPTNSPPASGNSEWTQHAHDAQRTSYTDQVVPTPWRWKWAWNGPNSSGGISSGKFGLPRNSQPVTGGGRVYIAAGANGVYALNNANGSVVWSRNLGSPVNSTPAYDPDTNALFVVAANGTLYKLNSATGATLGQFSSGSSSNLPLPPAVISDRVFFSMGTRVYAINKQTMSQIWAYNAGVAVHTPPAYSPSRNRVIAVTEDLYVHAIDNATGTQVWRVKPTVRTGGDPGDNNSTVAEVKYGWPVIAEAHGYVLIKLRLDWQALWDASPWPTDNAAMRVYLQQNPEYQALFVLDLDDGSVPFIAHVGHGGFGDGGYLPMGPQPVVKRYPNGDELVYTVIRGRECSSDPACDGRWDSHLGELMLDDTTVPGYLAGYVRFIQNTFFPTDEQAYVSMSGDFMFGGHWEAGIAHRIVDRSPARGTFSNPIVTENLPHIVTSQDTDVCGTGFSATHYCEQGLSNTRIWPGGFYIYWQQGAVYDQYWSEYATWVVSNNTVYFVSTDGAVVALESAAPNQTGAIFRVERTTGNVYADGQFYAGGADLAEHIRVSEPVEPSDVVELDPERPGSYRKSRRAYSLLVAGVISSAPGFIIGARNIETLWSPTLALAGVVPVKVTAENGPIRPGDLLTTSSVIGHAMRCAHPRDCEGALIGKALGSLESGTGVVLMLVVR